MLRYADLVPGFFGIYSGTLGRPRFCVLQYLWGYAMSTSFLYSSIFMVIRYVDLISVFFGTYSSTLRSSGPVGFFGTYSDTLFQSGISGQDAQSASVTCSVFFLSVGSVSQRKVASGRAAAEEG